MRRGACARWRRGGWFGRRRCVYSYEHYCTVEVPEWVSELLRHRHTVEQYGVQVEISTEAPRVSYGSTRSMYTRLQARGHVLNPTDSCSGVAMLSGIGVFFNTRKGSFQYKISLYIIIYPYHIIVYHVYHHLVSHISCPSSTHDI